MKGTEIKLGYRAHPAEASSARRTPSNTGA